MPSWSAPGNIVAGTTLRQVDDAPPELPGKPCWLHQVHGSAVVDVGYFAKPPRADASVGRHPGDVCIVQTADCLPVLFCSCDGTTVAAAHAGWRGLAAGVLENTVASMNVVAGDVTVWLGPAISQASFEVGEEVRAAFVDHDQNAATCFTRNARGRWQADLYALARQRLNSSGVTRIHGGGCCTYRDEARFFSYRREPRAGRMLTYIQRQ
jgi:YfiH family protein